MGNIELEQKTEKLARKIAKEKHGTEALWELYLGLAYHQIFFPNVPYEGMTDFTDVIKEIKND